MSRKASTLRALVWSLVLFPLLGIVVLAWCAVIVGGTATALVLVVLDVLGWPLPSGWPIIAVFFAFATPVYAGFLVSGLKQARPGRQGSLQKIHDFVQEKLWIEAQLPRHYERVLTEEGTRATWGELRDALKWQLGDFRKDLKRLDQWGHAYWDEGQYERLDKEYLRWGLSLKHPKLPWQ